MRALGHGGSHWLRFGSETKKDLATKGKTSSENSPLPAAFSTRYSTVEPYCSETTFVPTPINDNNKLLQRTKVHTMSSQDRERLLMRIYLTINCLCNLPMYSMMIGTAIYILLLYATPWTWLRTMLLLYLPFCLLDPRPSTGHSGFSYSVTEWCRSAFFYDSLAAFFPVHLHKTTDLSADNTYMFLYHPHGVICMGSNVGLLTNACHFNKLFPGIERYQVALRTCFWFPFFREWLLALGCICPDRKTLESKLRSKQSIVLLPGGAAEALHAHRKIFRLYIKHRKGFIRLALDTGAVPVPCLGFGENDIFKTYESRSLMYWQERLYKIMSFSLPILTSIFPIRHPIDVVVGEPVGFRGKTVDECHQEYLEAVRQLYEKHKANYGYKDVPIEFL